MASLRARSAPGAWRDALASYEEVLAHQSVAKHPERDRSGRELVRITEWKMARGVWRARNLILVRGKAGAS